MNDHALAILAEPFPLGSWVMFGKEVFRFLRPVDPEHSIIQPLFQTDSLQVKTDHLRPLEDQRFRQDLIRSFDTYPIERQNQAIRRREVIGQLLGGEWTKEAIEQAAASLNVSSGSVRRYALRYVLSGFRLEALVPRVFRFGLGNNKLSPGVEEVIQDVLAADYLTKERPSDKSVVRTVQRICRERRLKPPCPASIVKRIKDLPADEAMLHRLGAKAVREVYRPLPGRAPEGDGPLAMVEIDHTPINLCCVMPGGKKRRPWITMAIDAFTRMVLGFYLSFDEPSRLSVGLCLYRVLSPKEEWLRRFGITTHWPSVGKPRLIQVDNAAEFRSYDMDRICTELDIVLQWRPVETPDYGGRIERLMGAAALAVDLLPGKTFRSVTERKDYPVEKLAIIDLQTLEKALLHYFVQIYHHREHRGLRNRSPIHEWRTHAARIPESLRPTPVTDNHRFLSLLPTFDRTIQQSGVSWETIQYYDPIFSKYIRKRNPETADGKYPIAFDPRDIRCVYWRKPQTKQWFRIWARDLGKASCTAWDLAGFLEADREEAKSSVDQEVVDQGDAAIAAIAKEQKGLSLKAFKQRKRGKKKVSEARTPRGPLRSISTANVPLSSVADLVPQPAAGPETDPSIWFDIPDYPGRSI